MPEAKKKGSKQSQTGKTDGGRAARDFSGMFRGAFSHPEDRRALHALEKIPGVKAAMKQLGRYSYEKVVRLSLAAKCVRAGPSSYPLLAEMMEQACRSLDVPVPELYVRQDPNPSAYTIGPDRPLTVLSAGLVDLLEEDEMFAALAHQASHIHCGHLWYLMVCDFVRDAGDSLGIAGAPLAGPHLALEEWRRRAELSCDRGALLVSGDLDAVLGLLGKLAGGTRRDTFGGVDPAALAAQEEAFAEGTRGLSLGRLYRTVMYMDTQNSFAALRAAEIRRWAESETYASLAAGEYARAEESAARERRQPPLWGAFAGPEGHCPLCGQVREETDAAAPPCPGMYMMGGLQSAARSAAGAARTGATAFGKALGAFFGALQREDPVSEEGPGCGCGAVKIPVRGED